MNDLSLPAGLSDLAACFDKPLYVVGGFVRDGLLGLPSHDVDLTGDFDPQEIFSLGKERFAVHETSKKLMTLKIVDKKTGRDYEFTSFRVDSYSDGNHTPDEVKRTGDIYYDALRRDFCANAVYYDVKNGRIVDPIGGVADVKDRVLRMTRESTFREDGLRLMRLCRQAAETGFSAEEKTLRSARENNALIDDISPERIRDELDRLLVADIRYGVEGGQYRGLELLDEIGVFERIFPEIALGKGMLQRPDFHCYDVQEHIFRTVCYSDPSVRLAALLHDCAKPYCKKTNGNYRGHEIEGDRIAEEIMRRLRYSNSVIKETKALVRWHMYDLKCDAKENTVRRFLQKNEAIVKKLLLLKQADYLGCGLKTGKAPGVEKMERIYREMQEENVPFSIKDLAVDGNDLTLLQVPKIRRSEALQSLLTFCADKDSPYRTREKQLQYLQKFAD